MSKSIAVATALLIVGAAAATLAARPAPEAPTPPAEPATPRPGRAPRPPHDRMLFFSSGGSWLGVSIADVTAERMKELRLKEEMGAEIKSVMPGSPAEEAGLEKEDVILEFQGERVAGAAQLTRLVRETPPGRTVTLDVSRGGSVRSVKVKVTEQEHSDHNRIVKRIEIPSIDIPPIEIPEIDMPEIPMFEGIPSSFRLGVSVEDLTGQLGEYFGVKNGDGVLVRSVKKGSPADAGGLRAGDVIVKVDGEKIADSSDLRSAMRERRGRTFPLGVVRERRETTLTVTLPKRDTPPPEDIEDGEEEESSRDSLFEKRIEEGVRQKMEKVRARLEAARARIEAAGLLSIESI